MTMTTVLEQTADPIDAIPEYCYYEDTGCEASDSCLNCPLPKCKHDDPAWYQRNRRLAKDFHVMYTIERDRLSMEEAAERFSITVRTVFRILQRCRAALTESGAQEMGALAA